MKPVVTMVRLPVALWERVKKLARLSSATEDRDVPAQEVLARVVEAGLDVVAERGPKYGGKPDA